MATDKFSPKDPTDEASYSFDFRPLALDFDLIDVSVEASSDALTVSNQVPFKGDMPVHTVDPVTGVITEKMKQVNCVSCLVKGGVAGEKYTLTFKASWIDEKGLTQVRERSALLSIKEL